VFRRLFNFRALVRLIAFLLIAVFIWFAGPYFAFGSFHPLESDMARYIAIALIVVLWLVLGIVKWLRASQATDKLVGAISQMRPEKERPSAEATKLRERFDEAIAALKQRGGRSLYDLPWYVFIGAPGSGKTTALVNSGLRFPLEQRVGKGAVRGVGGTRNCDWWFTDEAVFLDTAGRYTTQDSDQSSDSEGWREFLTLLRTYRVRRPLNGVILTISCQDLLTQSEAERETYVEAARRRLQELTDELRVQLPVYVMVTKCDMVPGFTDYFDDLNQDGRAQVWGVTFPYEQTLSGAAPGAIVGEFDALIGRLNDRVFARVDAERGGRRRASVFAFPQQMAALRDLVAGFVGDVFSASRADRQLLLRGVYFTSGTQDGTQIDRLLGAIGRRFGVAADAVAAPAAGKGKAYFVERLLKEIVIGESGLAGVNRRLEFQKAAWQMAAYAATVLVVVVGLIVLYVSYSGNRSYLDQVANDVATLKRVRPPAARASLEGFLPYLNAARAVSDSANRYRDGAPWSMRWGLYQGNAIGNAARDAYLRELDSVVLPRFAARVRQRMGEYGSEPEKLYVYLKAYLMLGDPRRLDKKHLQFVADLEWPPPLSGAASGALPSTHFRNLLEYSGTLRPIAIDPTIVTQARNNIRQTSIPQIIYGQMQRKLADDANGLHFDQLALGVEKVLRRRSGRKMSDPVPAIYTQKVFKEATGPGILPYVKAFAEEEWVWGTGGVAGAAAMTRLGSQVSDIYERDYASFWDATLNDLEIVPFASVQQYVDGLGILTAASSPLKGVLKVAADNTSLIGSTTDPAKQSVTSRITEGARDLFNTAQQKATGAAPAGAVVTQRFEPIHRLMAGAPAPFDAVIEQMKKIRDGVARVAPQLGATAPLSQISDPGVRDLWRSVEQDAANLPPPVDRLVKEVVRTAESTIIDVAKSDLDKRYAGQVVARCRAQIEGKYPFAGTRSEIPLTDFGEVFGYGGLYDKFFTENLDKVVDTLQTPWMWRAGALSSSADLLPQFQRVERIRRLFFAAGSKDPQLNFTLTLSSLDKAATRFFLEINGQRYDVKPGAAGGSPAAWPGANKAGLVYAAFEDNVAAPERLNVFNGPWALFRLVDATRQPPSGQGSSDTDLASVLRIESKYHQAQVTIEAANAASNPFAASDWRQFSCER
jgi:type VI secretion system protein ImpL